MSQALVLGAIKTAIDGILPLGKYTTFESKIDKSLVADTQLPIVLISTINTDYAQQSWNSVIETYDIAIMLILLDDGVTAPLTILSNAQGEILTALFASFLNGAGSSIILKQSLELKNSSISNTVKQYEFGSAFSCVLNLKCKVGRTY